MVKKGRKMWRGLAFRLLYVVCSTFLPLIIVSIIISGIVIWKSSEQVLEAYQRELNSSMSRLEMEFQKIDSHMDEFVLEYLTELTLSDGSDNMVSYEMVNNLGEFFSDAYVGGILYLYDRIDERLFVKYSGVSYSILEIEEIKQQIKKDGIPQGTLVQWQIYSLEDRFFYRRHYEYTNYQVGFLIDIKESLSSVLEGLLLEGKTVYFTDGSGIVKLDYDSAADVSLLQWEDIFRDKLLYQSMEWNSQVLKCSVRMQISRGSSLESVPVLYWLLLVIVLLSSLLIRGLWILLQKRVVQPLNKLQAAMKHLEQENLEYRIESKDPDETDDFLYLYKAFNHMAEEIKHSHEKDIMMYQAQFDNLRLQVNPHMLLNSFNMIYSLAQTKNFSCIQEFSMLLVEYFRYALKETNTFVTVEKEMKFVESYIGIQKIRFPGTFASVYNIQPGCEKALVPPLLIENFVENSMKYALIPGEIIEVLINIRRQEDSLLISICDTGRGIKEDVLDCIQKGEIYTDKIGQKHIGIWNCRRRLEVFYSGSASMNIISNREEGTQIWLELPFLE